MRQTNIFRLYHSLKPTMLCIMLLLFSCLTSPLFATIDGVAARVTYRNASTGNMNMGGGIDVDVEWMSDTDANSPYTVNVYRGTEYKGGAGGLTDKRATISISGSVWESTNGYEQARVEVIGLTGDKAGATAPETFSFDGTQPNLTSSNFVSGNNGNFGPNELIQLQLVFDKNVLVPEVTCEGRPFSTTTSAGVNNYIFTLQLDGSLSNGSHQVSIKYRDTTEPTASANRNESTVSFSIGSQTSGNTTIDNFTPPSPTNQSLVAISGTCPTGTSKIALYNGNTEIVPKTSFAGTSWNLNVPVSESTYNFVAVSYDQYDVEIGRSSPSTYVVDQTAPSKPTYNSADIPTHTNAAQQQFTVTVDNYESELSTPVYLLVYNKGNESPNKYNITNQGNPITFNVTLEEGQNVIYFRAQDGAGNLSEQSDSITINKAQNSTVEVSTVMVDTYSVPTPTSIKLGPGTHDLKINFNQACGEAVPVVEIQCGGGSKIVANCTWKSNMELSGTFVVPNNGGASFDGGAGINIKDVKDTYGNTVTINTYADAFQIDSTPPISTITGNTTVYVSANNTTLPISGTVDDGENGSGIDYLKLIVRDSTGAEVATENVALQLNEPSPWGPHSFNASSLAEGTYTLVTVATDRAVATQNVESASGKVGITVIVDKVPPQVTRISFNNTGEDFRDGTVLASDVTRLVTVASETAPSSGLDLTNTNFIFNLTKPDGSLVSGEKTNNGVDTIYFDFQVLTDPGTYTVTVTPLDLAGNAGTTVTRTFILNKSTPDAAEFNPPNQSVANKTDASLAQNEVRVVLSNSAGSSTPSYTSSTISVKYNGLEVGEKVATETEALVAKLQNGNLKTDGSQDGNYYITIIPHSTTGVTGNAINGNFIYDTLPPVVTSSTPSIADEEIWFGKSTTRLSVTLSDAPKDIVEHYSYNSYPVTPVMPGDTSWYNGSGSGINFNVSSFTWKMGSMVSSVHNVSGTQLTVQVPPIPEDTTPGVGDVEVTIITADNVTQGETVPNTNTINRTYKFDYMEPKINVVTQNGSKYCKNLLTVKATAQDQGSNDSLQVTKIEYSEDGTTWNTVQSEDLILPAKETATFTLKLDITNKTDGTYTVKFRAVDRAGNTSSVVDFSYIVDRTPPSPPELTIPLADYTVNKRTQSFKWSSVNGVDAYLFQVSDDSAFNNILNHQANATYPTLLGYIGNTTDGSYTLPKDGTFYWRVASIERCEDGYNVGQFSETRKLIIDTVKPYILSVAPSPSSSNTVSTGMVTFTIRFSEPIDSTVDLAAVLTSAGGQVMKIEKVSCTGDTWTGTTVIPKNNSAVYDGNAIISVEGAQDLAGNKMNADNTNTIVVNTGPAFTTKLFSNPANEYEITIITKSTESLQSAPSITVSQNSVKTAVTMNFIKDKFYTGSYKIDKDNPGSAYIKISGTDLYGMVGNSTVEFVIADVNSSARLNVAASSGRASLKAAAGATYSPTSVYIIDREVLESPFSNGSNETTTASIRASAGVRTSTNKANSELVGVLGLDEVGPSSTKLKKCMLYTADVNGEVIDTSKANKIHIYRQDSKGNWIFQGGELKNYKISAQITGLGRLALMSDTTAPKMSSLSPSNQSKLDTNYPEIKGQFVDNGSGLLIDSFKLYIDDLQVKNVEMNKDGSFNYQVKQPLKEGKHEIKCEVNDKAGNSFVRAVTVDAPALLRIGEFSPYPNPARGNRISFAYNFGALPDSANLKIYDSAGHLVAKFGTEDFDRISGSIRWDLTNQKGKRIANGTYIYRLEVTANGQKIKKRGKFAVLR